MLVTPRSADIERELRDLQKYQRSLLALIRKYRQEIGRINVEQETQHRLRAERIEALQRSHLSTLLDSQSNEPAIRASFANAKAKASRQPPLLASEERFQRNQLQPPQLEQARHLLQTLFPVLYAQVLEPTLADLHQEHSAALATGRLWKARRVLLQGYCALAAAAICQLGVSLLGRIAALWQARSSK